MNETLLFRNLCKLCEWLGFYIHSVRYCCSLLFSMLPKYRLLACDLLWVKRYPHPLGYSQEWSYSKALINPKLMSRDKAKAGTKVA